MSLTAYIRYDSQGRIVPGGPIVTKTKPAVGNWQVVSQGTSATIVGQLRGFVKLDRYNKPLAGSLFLGKSKPATGKWLEVNATYEIPVAPTTTTTTSSSTSTTTTTSTSSSTSTTTTSTTITPLNFTLSVMCNNPDPTINPYIQASNFTGGSTGLMYPSALYTTEVDALNGFFNPYPKGSIDIYTYSQTGGYAAGQVYWVAVQDIGNPSNKLAKSITITSC